MQHEYIVVNNLEKTLFIQKNQSFYLLIDIKRLSLKIIQC